MIGNAPGGMEKGFFNVGARTAEGHRSHPDEIDDFLC
jgi:hypothetical protein